MWPRVLAQRSLLLARTAQTLTQAGRATLFSTVLQTRVASTSAKTIPPKASSDSQGPRLVSKSDQNDAAVAVSGQRMHVHKYYDGPNPAALPPLAPRPHFDAPCAQAFVRDFMTLRPVDYIELPRNVYMCQVRRDILHRCVVWQRDALRQGTHSTRGRSEVQGSNRKIRPQKGSGRARAGMLRVPHFRHGGTCHGPVPRSHATKLPRKVRELGLRSAITAKYCAAQLVLTTSSDEFKTHKTRALLDHLNASFPPTNRRSLTIAMRTQGKTQAAARHMRRYGSVLFVSGVDYPSPMLTIAAGRLEDVSVIPAAKLNVYDVLHHEYLVLDQEARTWLEWRLQLNTETETPPEN